jgi:hypothetical protein
VKYLVGRFGLVKVVNLMPEKDPLSTLEAFSGSTALTLRADLSGN